MTLILQWKSMSVSKNYFVIFIYLLACNNLFAADLVDVYNRAIKYNDDYRIVQNDKEISLQQYNQTASSILPEIRFQAGTKETIINRYIGPGENTDFNTDSYNLTLQQPIFRLAFFDELDKSDAITKKSESLDFTSFSICISFWIVSCINLILKNITLSVITI